MGVRTIGPAPAAEVRWQPIAGANVYNVYRGLAGPLVPADFVPSLACLLSEIPETSFVDLEVPPAGEYYAYLVVGINVCGEGEMGQGSAGTGPRVAATPCLPVGAEGGPQKYALYRQPVRRDMYAKYKGKMLAPLMDPFEQSGTFKLDGATAGGGQALLSASGIDPTRPTRPR